MAERLRDFIVVQSTAADVDEFEFTAGGSSTITGDIFVTYTVLELVSAVAPTFQGASVTLSVDSAETATDVNVGFDTELFDTDSIHDNVTNNSRLTVPTGWTKVELGYTLHVYNVTNALDIQTGILKNGTLDYPNNAIQTFASRFGAIRSSGATGPIAVTGGDYFQLTYYSGGDTSTTIDASKTGFWMKRLE